MTVMRIEGKFIHADGQETSFSIDAEHGWQQWGNTVEVLGRTGEVCDSIAAALSDDSLWESDSDDEDDDERGGQCRHCGQPIMQAEDGSGWTHYDGGGEAGVSCGVEESTEAEPVAS